MKKFRKYNILLHNTTNFDECLKEDFRTVEFRLVNVEKFNSEVSGEEDNRIDEGRIYVKETADSPVEWIRELNEYTQTQFDINDFNNKSNKAVMMLKYRDKLFSIVYGYGRTMLEDSSIVKGFGLRTAINLISDENIKSLATLNVSDDYIDTHRQALNSVSQNSLFVNTDSEILKSISGKADDSTPFSNVHGSDSILLSASTDFTILDILENLISAYESNYYKDKGFEWVDHIQLVKDKSIIKNLEELLIAAIQDTQLVSIAPNKIIALDKVGGYFIKGMNLGLILDNFYDEIPTKDFVDYII
ncbi:TPA: TIGR04141 family sporadically distributed protein, partial [Streptococcus suis]|nr:TIGR04141 family sporadically distributed protein [Streptococcus suis]